MQPMLISEDAYAGKPNPCLDVTPAGDGLRGSSAGGLHGIGSDGAEQYAANAGAYRGQLARLDDELRQDLASIPEQRRLLVTCEGAFSYLAKDYGLEEAYLWPVNAESQVTPKRMARLIATVRDRGVPAVFCESTVSDKAQRDVAAAAGARFGGTFYVDSLSEQGGPAATLLDLQRHNVNLIRIGLQEQQPPMEQQP